MASSSSKTHMYKNIANRVDVSHEALDSVISDLKFDTSLDLNMQNHDSLSIELRAFRVEAGSSPLRVYMAVFCFSKEKANRLCILNESIANEIVDHLSLNGLLIPLSRYPWSGTTLILIGKGGSKSALNLWTVFTRHKIVVFDFPGTSIEEFVTMILTDIDKTEQKGLINQSHTNAEGFDLAVVPVSDKRVRLTDDMSEDKKQETIFVNQLLQVPGITEKVGQSIAQHFIRPARLLTHATTSDCLAHLTFQSARGDAKKLNSRIQTTLFKLYQQGARHDELIR